MCPETTRGKVLRRPACAKKRGNEKREMAAGKALRPHGVSRRQKNQAGLAGQPKPGQGRQTRLGNAGLRDSI